MNEDKAIEALWAYHQIEEELKASDVIFVLGSNDPRVADWAAELYHRGLAPYVLFSGGSGRFTEGLQNTEAERFAIRAIAKGVPEQAILLEKESTNTGENIRFSRGILDDNGLDPQSIIAVQKPYMLRRTRATLEAQWKGMPFQISGPPLSFQAYLSAELPHNLVVSAMVGDYQRIQEYPKQGFSSPQAYDSIAQEAFEYLVQQGYTSQLLV